MTKYRILHEDELTEKDMKEYHDSMSYIQGMFDTVMDKEFNLSYYANYSVQDIEFMSVPDIEYHSRRVIEARMREKEELENRMK